MAPRVLHKLNSKQVASATNTGRLSESGGLYLSIDSDRKRWVFMYALRGRQREMGLGVAGKEGVSLAR